MNGFKQLKKTLKSFFPRIHSIYAPFIGDADYEKLISDLILIKSQIVDPDRITRGHKDRIENSTILNMHRIYSCKACFK